MPNPPDWSEAIWWMKNFERVVTWIDAALSLLHLTDVDYAHFVQRQSFSIKDTDMREAVAEHGPYAACLLEYIEQGLASLSKNAKVPQSCVVNAIDMAPFASKWKKHVLSERTSMPDLEKLLVKKMEEMKAMRKRFYEEPSDEYSSYSDYSEEETDSDEEARDDDDDAKE